jgi:undecaprenyl phosphate N,N'-diacetylbacillosamine 1-phosphate transferase|tara:strand:+ start:636 stop:1238 length:603 start_codon:yes stop_codon:yes gene_type:complete
MKRFTDLLFATILILLLSPIFLLLSIFILIDSKGGVFFLQDRIGLNRKKFRIIKFRTMVKNAESTGTGIFTNKNDDRITNFGNFLRKYSLDELPQIFNVFKGEMSIVGPRPPVLFHPYKIDQYPEEYIKRFNFKPGITGLAQISGRTNITWEERFVFDLIYINNYSILLDVKILFTTVKNIFKKIEVYPSEEYIKNNHKN